MSSKTPLKSHYHCFCRVAALSISFFKCVVGARATEWIRSNSFIPVGMTNNEQIKSPHFVEA